LIRGETTKTRETRETYLTTEAVNILKDYLSKNYGWIDGIKNENCQNQIIFDRTAAPPKNKPSWKSSPTRRGIGNLEAALRKYTIKIPELAKLNRNGRFQVHFHAFRKVFYTAVSNSVGSDFANALLGHHFYLDTYYSMPESKRKELYLKAEPHITISDISKLEQDLLSMQEKQNEIEHSHLELLRLIKQGHISFPKKLENYIK